MRRRPPVSDRGGGRGHGGGPGRPSPGPGDGPPTLEHVFCQDVIAGLNEAQAAAVRHTGGPLLVVAGAGTGKTRTLAARVAHLLDSGVAPERILLLTFSRRAAQEMLRRAADLGPAAGAARVWGGTFHAVAHRVLRRACRSVGLDPGFSVLDQSDATDLFALVRSDLGLSDRARRFPRADTLAAIYSRLANAQERLDVVLAGRFPWCRDDAAAIGEVFTSYTARKREHNLVDFDDLLLYWRALLLAPEVPALKWDHVLVDEYQDTNAVQGEIVGGLVRHGATVCAVGDDAQAIYGFRAASPANMAEFPERFPEATVLRLEENYRSTPPILDVANALLRQAPGRYPRTLWSALGGTCRPTLTMCADETAQADLVAQRVLAARERGVPLTAQAVLFRTGHHSAGLELELARRNIPFVKFGGLRFLEAAHVKDLLALLRVLDNARDELAWRRVAGLLEGVGPAATRDLLASLGVRPQVGTGDPVRRFLDGEGSLPPVALPEADRLRGAFSECASGIPPAVQVERLAAFCEGPFRRRYREAAGRLRDLEHLANVAAGYATRDRFLAELTLDPPASTSDLAGDPGLDDEYLVLSTIHSAKGGEWRAVHLIHASDGNIPSDMALAEPAGVDEERRLLYVAVTRAKDELHVTWPLRFHHRRFGMDAAHTYAQPSRFLTPVETLFDHAEAGTPDTGDAAAGGSESLDVRAALAALWS